MKTAPYGLIKNPDRFTKSGLPKIKRKHWYQMHVGNCPACGRDQSYRIRVYGSRPENIQDRYVYLSDRETYDHCQEGVW